MAFSSPIVFDLFDMLKQASRTSCQESTQQHRRARVLQRMTTGIAELYKDINLPQSNNLNRFGQQQQKQVLNNRFEIQSRLGSGRFSTVYLARDYYHSDRKFRPCEVAIKVVNLNYEILGEREKLLLSHIPSRSVINLIDHFYWEGHCCLVFPFFKYSLFDIITSDTSQSRANSFSHSPVRILQPKVQRYNEQKSARSSVESLTDNLARVPVTRGAIACIQAIARQALEALCELHQHQIIHADIKPENCFVQCVSTGFNASSSSSSSSHNGFNTTSSSFPTHLMDSDDKSGTGISSSSPFHPIEKFINAQNRAVAAELGLVPGAAPSARGIFPPSFSTGVGYSHTSTCGACGAAPAWAVEFKLADLGNSIHANEIAEYDDFEIQTLQYRAPEVLLGLELSSKIDVWSIGVTLLELCCGKTIFELKNDLQNQDLGQDTGSHVVRENLSVEKKKVLETIESLFVASISTPQQQPIKEEIVKEQPFKQHYDKKQPAENEKQARLKRGHVHESESEDDDEVLFEETESDEVTDRVQRSHFNSKLFLNSKTAKKLVIRPRKELGFGEGIYGSSKEEQGLINPSTAEDHERSIQSIHSSEYFLLIRKLYKLLNHYYSGFPLQLIQFLASLLQWDPSRRLSAQQALAHQFLVDSKFSTGFSGCNSLIVPSTAVSTTTNYTKFSNRERRELLAEIFRFSVNSANSLRKSIKQTNTIPIKRERRSFIKNSDFNGNVVNSPAFHRTIPLKRPITDIDAFFPTNVSILTEDQYEQRRKSNRSISNSETIESKYGDDDESSTDEVEFISHQPRKHQQLKSRNVINKGSTGNVTNKGSTGLSLLASPQSLPQPDSTPATGIRAKSRVTVESQNSLTSLMSPSLASSPTVIGKHSKANCNANSEAVKSSKVKSSNSEPAMASNSLMSLAMKSIRKI